MSIHSIFVIVSLIFGIGILWITPPFQSPDETNHLHRIVHISEGNLICHQYEGNRLGGNIDNSYLTFSSRFDQIRKSRGKVTKADFDWAKSVQTEGNEFVDIANVGYYSPTVYLPLVLGYCISKVVDMKPYDQLYVLRFINLLSWIILLSLSIKLIPVGKTLVAFIGLLPSHMALASSISGDTFSHALCFLWIALMLRAILSDHQVQWKEILIWLLIMTTITINKVVYFPLVFMIYLIPKSHWGMRTIMSAMLVGVTLVTLVCWIPYSSNLFIPYDQYAAAYRDDQQLNPGVNPAGQLHYVMTHTLEFIWVSLKSYVQSIPATWAHYIGKFGWEKNYLHPIIMMILTIVLGINVRYTSMVEPRLSRNQRILMLVVGLLMICGFTLSIYMQWSPVGHTRVRSLSGRYFIPIIPLLLLAIPRGKTDKTWMEVVTLGVSVLGLVALLLAIWMRYY